jgi:autotransporter strand-loop-strand O-heptosyltransferase
LVSFEVNFVSGPYIFIKDDEINNDYVIKFYNHEFERGLVYETRIKSNHWFQLNRKWFTLWRIEVYNNKNERIFTYVMDLSKLIVRVNITSRAMGDNLGWMPYIEEFRKKHNCKMVCSTYLNDYFRPIYKDIRFVKPGEETPETTVVYNITYFDEDEGESWDDWQGQYNPKNPYKIPLQKIACDILGLKYEEKRPSIFISKKIERDKYMKEKYVCISEHSTAKAKLWNNENGWQELVDYLNSVGYKVVVISKEPTELKRVINRTGNITLDQRIKQLYHCEFYIGVGSGLAWLAWTLGKKVVMISGFSKPFTEFVLDNIRVYNPNVCSGCFSRFKFIKEDWEWCPIHKGTEKEFECTKTITSQMVIDKMKEELWK